MPSKCGRHDQGLGPCARCTALLLPLLYGKHGKAIFAPVPILVQQGSRTDTVVETSEVVTNAPCKALPLNVGLVVWFHAMLGPFCAPVRVPAVAHTHPAGALWQKREPH